MSEFHDPELRQQLGRLSGPYPDENAAFVAWQRRVGQVRRRRAMAWTTAAAMSLILGVVGAAAMQGQVKHSTVPQKSLESSSVSTSVAETRAKPVTIDSTRPPETEGITPDQNTTQVSEASIETAVVTPDSSVDVPKAPPATTHKSQGGSSSTQGTPTAPTQATPPSTDNHESHAVTQRISSIGGTITVRQDREQLTVIDISPATGFQGHQSGSPGHGVGVTFTSATHRSEISVVMYHGEMVPKVIEKNDTHESVPTTDHSAGD